MRMSPYAWSFGKSKKHGSDLKTDSKTNPGPGMYVSNVLDKEKGPTWR